MKKSIIIFFCVSFVLFCSACVNFCPINIVGMLQSESPKIRINIQENPAEFWDYGELIQDDNTAIKIAFGVRHGDFRIYEFRENGKYEDDTILFKGQCRQKNDTVVLYVDDGSKIILKKVEVRTGVRCFFSENSRSY